MICDTKKKTGRSGKNGGSKEDCVLAKKVAKQRVFETDTHVVYCIVKQIKQENKDIFGKQCIRNDNGVLVFNEEDKKKACKRHC